MNRILFYLGYQSKKIDLSNGLESISLGGSESCVVQLAYELSKSDDYSITIVGSDVHNCYLNDNKIRCLSISELRHEVLDNNEDNFYDRIIAINYINYPLVLNFLQWNSSIFWLHNTEPFPYFNGQTLDEDYCLHLLESENLNLIVCVSECQAEIIRNNYPSLQHKIIVIENGYNHNQIPLIFNKFKSTPRLFLNFTYGSAVDRGLDRILEIWPSITNQLKSFGIQTRLTICCPIYSEPYLKDYVNAIPGVIFLGSLQKNQWLSICAQTDYWLYPTDYFETFCIAGHELLASQAFPLISNVGNLQSIVSLVKDQWDLYDALNINCDNNKLVNQIVDQVLTFEQYPNKLEFFNNLVCAIAKFDWSNVVQKWKPILSKLTIYDLAANSTIISLKNPTYDRIDAWCNQLIQAGFDVSMRKPFILPAVNGNDVNDEYLNQHNLSIYQYWKIPNSTNSWWNREILPGELGCAISHLNAWRRFNETNLPYMMFFEDDFTSNGVQLTDEILAQLPCDWDMLYLGRNPLTVENNDSDVEIYKPGPSYNMHAYVLSRKGVLKLLQQNFDQYLMPVDEFIQGTYVTHARPDLQNIWRDSITYALKHDVFVQNQPDRSYSQTETIHLPDQQLRVNHHLFDYYHLNDQWLRKYVMSSVLDMDYNLAIDEPIPHVFCWKMFTDAFCNDIIEQSEQINGWTTDRHAFYPTTDMLLTTIGFNEIYNDILSKYVEPIIRHVYQLDGNGWVGMRNENFVARYTEDTQTQLKIHHDSSDITALVNLSQPDIDFTGGGTYFPKYKQLYRPVKGSISVHPGNITHKHGARQVWTGKRYIMVSFMSRTDRG